MSFQLRGLSAREAVAQAAVYSDVMSTWRPNIDASGMVALIALAISGLSFYRSYLYTKQDLEVTVTEVSYVTNQAELYVSIAFSNGGNRDAAVLRVEPALWD